MPSSADPAALTPADRARELARLLAAGLRRLRRPLPAPPPAPASAGQNVSENSPNGLACGAEPSVTVSTG